MFANRIGFGGDYNPEQWPEEVWAEDMALMKDAGVTVATIGVFSWALVEPRPGEFDFGWFDRVMDNLAQSGISACLATMTASPPPWLAARHPETLPVRADGVRLWPGSRQHYCPSSPVYRDHAATLVEQVATRYADHPALALWHIGNEYGCHVSACYCDVSAADFRRWLRERYETVDALNEAWSTAFWSQHYADWSEILPPRVAPTHANPAQQLDFARFSSDALLECFLTEKQIIRRISPDVPVTTNLMGAHKPVDAFAWAAHCDVVSNDAYPDPGDPRAHIAAAFTHDLMRSVGGGRPWLLMEQAPSAVNWRHRNTAKAPGQMRLWSWQAVARGADAVMFFQWRQSRGGAEKFHSGMVPHAGPETRTFREIRELGHELASVSELAGSTVPAEVACVLDWESWWALELDSHPSSDLNQIDTMLAHYAPLHQANITCDIMRPSQDLSGYRLVVVPNLYLVDQATAANLTDYVRSGGHLIMSFFSGIADECDRVHPGAYPAPFSDMLGLHIEEFHPLRQNERIGVSFVDGSAEGFGTLWSEDIHLDGADVVATFATGDLVGRPALTRHRFGAGSAWYLGTRPDETTMASVIDDVARMAGVTPVLADLPAGVEAVTRRAADGREFVVVLNHTADERSVQLPDSALSLLAGTPAETSLTLSPRGIAVLLR